MRAPPCGLAASFHGFPARRLGVIGVTGTDGKTTTAHLAAGLLEAGGWPVSSLVRSAVSFPARTLLIREARPREQGLGHR